ncbi:MAG: methyl-accepting chemotaxis protein, partial [Zoogloeaceae bacterium]|nr:methyl-accepting chemotaxis protein [Zoogloeaceae bacterium]
MKIKTRIRILATSSWLALVIVSLLGLYNSSNSADAIRRLNGDTMPKIESALNFRVHVNNLLRYIYEVGSKDALPHEEQVRELKYILEHKKITDEEVLKWFNTYDNFVKHPDVQVLWEKILPIWKSWHQDVSMEATRILEKAINNPTQANLENFHKEISQIGINHRADTLQITSIMGDIVSLNARLSREIASQSESTANKILFIQIAVSILIVIGIIFMGLKTLKAVVHPLEQVRNTVVRVEKENDLCLQVDYRSTDEVGETVDAFNAMMKRLQSSFQDIQQQVGEVTYAVESLNTAAQQVAASSSSQSSSTSAMAASVEEMTVSINTVASSA